MNKKKIKYISDAISDVDWQRIFIFMRGINEDTALNLSELRFAKARVLQYAFQNVSDFKLVRGEKNHNFEIETPVGLIRALIRFDSHMYDRTEKTMKLSKERINVVINNKQTGTPRPTRDDFDIIIVVGYDVAFCVYSEALEAENGHIASTNHQHKIVDIDRNGFGVVRIEHRGAVTKHFDNYLSQVHDAMLQSYASQV